MPDASRPAPRPEPPVDRPNPSRSDPFTRAQTAFVIFYFVLFVVLMVWLCTPSWRSR